jgi:hypothetical protein
MIDPTDDSESIENADATDPRLRNDMVPVSHSGGEPESQSDSELPVHAG